MFPQVELDGGKGNGQKLNGGEMGGERLRRPSQLIKIARGDKTVLQHFNLNTNRARQTKRECRMGSGGISVCSDFKFSEYKL